MVLNTMGDLTATQGDLDSAKALYDDALYTLVRMQRHTQCAGLRDYDEDLLRGEMALFSQWFLPRHLQRELSASQARRLRRAEDALVQACLEQPQIFEPRDRLTDREFTHGLLPNVHASPPVILRRPG